MPPSFPRSPLSSARLCKPCSTTLQQRRSFTVSFPVCAIGPENPRFIEVPLPPQRYAIPKKDIKGTLPPPRNLFSGRKGKKLSDARDEISPNFLAATTPEPSAHHQLSEAKSDYIAWKRRLATTRRENLREGLAQLHKRKLRQEKTVAMRSHFKRVMNEERRHAPQREDERLTNPTITGAMSELHVGHVPDPGREERIAEAAAQFRAKQTAQVYERQDALHTLYMNARSFITTSEQLNDELEKVFVQYPFGEAHPDKDNIWDAYGMPPTVQDMLSTVNNSQKSAIQYHALPGTIDGKRMKRIAEELTGGTLD